MYCLKNKITDGKNWINKIRKGMILRFPDGNIEIVIITGFIGKSNKFPNKKGARYFATEDRMIFGYDWNNIIPPDILGYADIKI